MTPAALRELWEKAITPRPWTAYDAGEIPAPELCGAGVLCGAYSDEEPIVCTGTKSWPMSYEDAEFIAEMVNTFPALLAAIEERDAEIARMRREVRRMASRLQRTHRNAGRFADDAAKATSRLKAAVKRALQDADEIATLTRQLAEANEENDRVWEQLRAVDDTLNALGCSQAETFTRSAAIQGIADEREKWLTASRVLCAAHVGVPQPACPVCALTTATAQRDAMRDTLRAVLEQIARGRSVSIGSIDSHYEPQIRREQVEAWFRALGAL